MATAYIADISEPEKKAQNFGLIGAAFGLGFIIGPVIGGLASHWGLRAPFLVAASLSFLNFLYGLIVLPESLPKGNRRKFKWKAANPVSSLVQLTKYPVVLSFVLPFFIIYLSGYAVQSTWAFFTIYRFNWDAETIGYSLAVVGLLVAVVQGGLVRLVVKRLGENKTVIFGMIMWAFGLFLFSFANKSWMMFVFLIPYCLGGVAGPTLQGIISNQVPADRQGELQGALTSIMSITAIVGPLLMTYIFSYFTDKTNGAMLFPGAAFFTGAIFMLISLFLTVKPLQKFTASKIS